MNDTTAYEAAFPVRAVSPSEEVEETAVCVTCGRDEEAFSDDFGGYVHPINHPFEARSANTAVDERPSTVASDGETAEVCDADASHRHVDAEGNYIWHRHSHQEPSKADPLGVNGFDEDNHHDPAEHAGTERVDARGWIGEPYAGAPRPDAAAPVEPLEGEWRRTERVSTGIDGGKHTEWVLMLPGHEYAQMHVYVPEAVEQAIKDRDWPPVGYEERAAWSRDLDEQGRRAAAAEERLTEAEERASTAERRLEGHENLAAAAIRERDEARGEVERLQAALEGIREWAFARRSKHSALVWVVALANRALAEARVSTPVREERGE